MDDIDYIDWQILNALQEDAKVNIKELAEKLNMTKTPIYERIRRMEKEGIIDRYVAIVNSRKISPYIIVYCSVSLDVQKADYLKKFRNAINKIPEVVECYLTGGAADFLLKVIVNDLQAYHEFASHKLAILSNVNQIKSSFVLTEVKHSTVFPVIPEWT